MLAAKHCSGEGLGCGQEAKVQAAAMKAQKLAVIAQAQATCGSYIFSVSQTHFQLQVQEEREETKRQKAQKLGVIAQIQVTCGSCIFSVSQTHFTAAGTGSGAL